MIRTSRLPSREFAYVLLCFMLNAYTSFPSKPLECESKVKGSHAVSHQGTGNPRCAAFSPIARPGWKLQWNNTMDGFQVNEYESNSKKGHVRELLCRKDIRECVQRKNILFVGNSHLRLLVAELLDVFGIDSSPLVKKRHSSHAFYISETETWVIFLWSTFSMSKPVSEYIDGFTDEREAHFPRDFDLVVCNRGAWDMLYHDKLPTSYFQSVADDLQALKSAFIRANIVFMNMNAFHKPNHKEMTDPQKTHRIEQCFNPERLGVYRSIHECALQRVNGWEGPDASRNFKFPIVWLLDAFSLTSALRPHWAQGGKRGDSTRSFVSGDGHHYAKEVNEAILQMVFRFFCGNVEDTGNEKARMFPAHVLAENCALEYRRELQQGLNSTLCSALAESFHGAEFHSFHEKYKNLCSNVNVYGAVEKLHLDEHIF